MRTRAIGLWVGAVFVAGFLENSFGQNRGGRIAPSHADVVYMDGTEANVLDLWIAESEEPTPLAIYIHGGGWNTALCRSSSCRWRITIAGERFSFFARRRRRGTSIRRR